MPVAATRSTGLRKFIPQPDRFAERYGRFTLTARDMNILEYVHEFRYLEARHVRVLVGGSSQQLTRRLQGLFHNGYLGRYARRERMRMELDSGAPLIAYGLELKGARALERHRGAAAAASGMEPKPPRWKKEYTRRTEWFLEHHLMVSNFRCVLELALRETPDTELVTWSQGKDNWFRVLIPGKVSRKVRLAPDAYFVLRQGDQIRHFYLEADRGTEEHRRLVAKFVGYWWHLQNAPLTDAGLGRPRVNILFVTVSPKRLGNLIATLRQIQKPKRVEFGGKGIFQFCCENSYSLDQRRAVLGPIWSAVNGSGFTLGG